MNRGVSRARLGQAKLALADFDRALMRADEYPAPLRAKIFANRANALAVLGRLAEARRDIDAAVRLSPDEPTYRIALQQMRSLTN